MKRMKKTWMLVVLSVVVSMTFTSVVWAYDYDEDEYSEYDNVVKEPLTFECDYYKKEATLIGVDSSVTNLVIPEVYDGCVVTTISNALYVGIYKNCVKAETVYIPSTVKTIQENAFKGCDYLKEVIFDDKSQIQNVGIGAFSDCEKLETVKLPNSIQYIDEYAFLWCPSLNNINIPNNTIKIGECAFMNCQNLNRIKLNDGLQIIEDNAFQGCALATINIPASVEKIGRAAFAYCGNLTSVEGMLKAIPDHMFYECSSLINVTLSD